MIDMKLEPDYVSDYIEEILTRKGIKISKYDEYYIIASDEHYFKIEYHCSRTMQFGGVVSRMLTFNINRRDYNNFLRRKKLKEINLYENR